MPPTCSPLASATHKVPTVLIDERIAPCENSPFKKNPLSKKSTREGGKKVHVAVIEVSAAGSDPADDGHLHCLSLDIKEGIFGGRRKKIVKQFLPFFFSPLCAFPWLGPLWQPSSSIYHVSLDGRKGRRCVYFNLSTMQRLPPKRRIIDN